MAKKRVRVLDKKEFFYSVDGKIIKSLADLHLALVLMDEKHFYFHVNENRHDFANWVEHVLDEGKLAQKIGTYQTREKVLAELADFLKKG